MDSTQAKMPAPLKVLHTYASDDAEAHTKLPQWIMAVRRLRSEGGGDFTFTVVVPTTETTCSMHELMMDRAAIADQIEELGVEVHTAAFIDLLEKTLNSRTCVDVIINDTEEAGEPSVHVQVTYKFSETIARKARMVMPCTGRALPLGVATLLLDMHTTTNTPVLSDTQLLQARIDTAMQAAAARVSRTTVEPVTTSSSQETDGDGASSTGATTITTAVHAQQLKRRHIPTGTARRKGPRGAKLAKIE